MARLEAIEGEWPRTPTPLPRFTGARGGFVFGGQSGEPRTGVRG
jgi:hypothetical protein